MKEPLTQTRFRQIQALILIFSGLIYLCSITGKLIWDDYFILSGSAIGGGHSLLSCFTKPFLVNYYRPVVSASFYLEKFISHHTPFFYHQTNILIHVLTTWLVIAILYEAFRNRGLALLGGALFAVQPVQIDAVAWIGGRTDSLCALWMALYAWSLIRAARAGVVTRKRWLALSVIAFALALFTKEQMLPAIILAPLAFRCWKQDSASAYPISPWRAFAPFGAVCAAYLALYFAFGPEPPDAIKIGPVAVIAQFLRTVTYYTLLLVAPTPRWINTMSLGLFARAGLWTVSSGAFILGAGCLAYKRLNKSEPAAAWLIAFIGSTILVVSNLWPVPSMLVAPYRAGVSGIGAACLIAWATWTFATSKLFMSRATTINHQPGFPGSPPVREPGTTINQKQTTVNPPSTINHQPSTLLSPLSIAGVTVYILWCGYLTAWGAGKWQNDEIAGATIVRYDPDSIWAHLNYTTALLNRGKKEPATREIEALLAKIVGESNWRSSDRVLKVVEKNPQILVYIREVQGTRKDPKQWLAAIYTQLAFARIDIGQRDNAKAGFKIALTLYPQTTEALLGIGTIAHIEGDDKKAEGYLRIAVALDYDRNESHVKLGLVLASLGKWQDARRQFEICIKQQPWVGMAYIELANSQINMGDRPAAKQTLEEGIRRSPNRKDIREKLAGLIQNPSTNNHAAPSPPLKGS